MSWPALPVLNDVTYQILIEGGHTGILRQRQGRSAPYSVAPRAGSRLKASTRAKRSMRGVGGDAIEINGKKRQPVRTLLPIIDMYLYAIIGVCRLDPWRRKAPDLTAHAPGAKRLRSLRVR